MKVDLEFDLRVCFIHREDDSVLDAPEGRYETLPLPPGAPIPSVGDTLSLGHDVDFRVVDRHYTYIPPMSGYDFSEDRVYDITIFVEELEKGLDTES